MAGPRSLFPLRYLDEAVGFLVPRSQVSFPVLRPRPAFRSFVPPFFVPCSQIYHNIKIGGDFNIDYRKSSSDKTKLSKTFMKKNTLLQIIDAPTRPLYNEAIIDLILTNTNKAQNSGIIDWNLSDHLPTFINIKKEKKTIFEKTTFRGRSYKNFTDEDFLRLLHDRHIENVCQNFDVKTAWETIGKYIEEVLDILAPV